MTRHAFSSYMKNAYPADELQPISCKGRYRNHQPESYSDYTLANLSLTLIDSLDTLAIMNLVDEFNEAIKYLIKDLRFDCEAYSSTFELNIRALGGLISGHISAVELKKVNSKLFWYKNELLTLAKNLADKLIKAFQTNTDIPYRHICLSNSTPFYLDEHTCTACGGTFILEFGALTILTGNQIYLQAALKALNFIWSSRSIHNLIGSTINIHTGSWTNHRSTIGSESDSYYEYLFKAYIQFSSQKMLHRFQTHYESISKYLKFGSSYYDMNFSTPNKTYYDSVDSLRAFFPSIQVMYGDVSEAIKYHAIFALFQKKHVFMPEIFSYDYKIIIPGYNQRPEFIESTYYLYRATKEEVYFNIAIETVENIEKFLKVPCGYASVESLINMNLEDRMETFLISELFKYLYLIFASNDDIPFDISKYIFSTEAHFMPKSNKYVSKSESNNLTCPVAHKNNFYSDSIQELWESSMGKAIVKAMYSLDIRFVKIIGATPETLIDEYQKISKRIHTLWERFKSVSPIFLAKRVEAFKDSIIFSSHIIFNIIDTQNNETYSFVGSQPWFGTNITEDFRILNHELRKSVPIDACRKLIFPKNNTIVLIKRGECSFVTKIKNAQEAGAVAAVIVDSVSIQPYDIPPIIMMNGDGTENESSIKIPSVFVDCIEGSFLDRAINSKEHSMIYGNFISSLIL